MRVVAFRYGVRSDNETPLLLGDGDGRTPTPKPSSKGVSSVEARDDNLLALECGR